MSKPKILGLCAFVADFLSLNVKHVRLFVFLLAIFFPREVLTLYFVLGISLRIRYKLLNERQTKNDSNPYDSSKERDNKDDFDDNNYMKF